MPDYQNGKIYKIINDINNILYIGSTCQLLHKRLFAHRSSANAEKSCTTFHTAMRAIGCHHFRILLIRIFPCKSKMELEAEEYRIITEVQSTGKEVYNDMIGGKHSIKSRKKMSDALVGKYFGRAHHITPHSEETKMLIRSIHLRRGCLSRKVKRKQFIYWSLAWMLPGGIRKEKTFSVKKYGEDGAHGLAMMFQDRIYPPPYMQQLLMGDPL